MADVRVQISWGLAADPAREFFTNTIYFAVDTVEGPVNYSSIGDGVLGAYQNVPWTAGCKLEVRVYDMADPKPRPEKAYKVANRVGTRPDGPGQVALCLSFYSERNLPRQRGRIYCGPWPTPPNRPTTANQTTLLDLATALANVGGVNVDWSVYSPTKASAGQDPTMSISDVWVDNAWDIIRSRQLPGQSRATRHIGE